MSTTTRTRVLVTVLTYPHPSGKYKELVCTAGVTAAGEWIRLYPVDYRYRPAGQRFHKYQWIELDVEPVGHGSDRRKESRKPHLDTMVAGDRLDTKDGWRERRRIIDSMPHHTVAQLEQMYAADRTSLGIVRPTKIHDVEIEPADPEWKPEWQVALAQFDLFEGAPKELAKLPFKWSYVFESGDDGKTHRRMIEDWELGVLFLKERERKGEQAAAESVREKYLTELCAPDLDTRFFMGTRFPYNVWLVLGVFYPPRVAQTALPW